MELPAHIRAQQYAAPAQLAQALAEDVAMWLRERINRQGRACLLLSGGRSPIAFLQALSEQVLPWASVQVSLVDERFVAPEEDGSNEALVRQYLLQGKACAAQFYPLYQPAESLEAAVKKADQAWNLSPDIVVLGMGEDGHCASLFSGNSSLEQALSLHAGNVVAMRAPQAPIERLSLTRQALAKAPYRVLAISGQAKLATLEQALAGQDVQAMPVRAFLEDPLAIYWSP